MKWWQKCLAIAVVSLALVGAGYAFGRFAAPTKSVTVNHEVTKTVTVTDQRAEQQVHDLTAQLEQLKLHSHMVRTVVTHVDGTSTATTTRDVDVERASQVSVNLSSVQVAATHVQVNASTERAHTSVVEHSAPKWFAGALATISPGSLQLSDPLASMSAGVTVGHFFGPVGLGLSITEPLRKPLQVPTFGLALTVAF